MNDSTGPAALEGHELVRRILAGDDAAFAFLFHELSGPVYRIARAITGGDDMAKEVVQDTFIRVHRKLASWNGDASLKTWVSRIAIRVACDALRFKRRQRELPIPDNTAHDPRAAMDRALLVASVRELGWRIPGRTGVVFRLRLAGHSNADIAVLLSISEANVRVQLSKAVRKVKEML